MSAFLRHKLRCKCGHEFDALLARSVNADRMPQLRDQIIAGTLNRAECPVCGAYLLPRVPLLYCQPSRGVYIRVEGPGRRSAWTGTADETCVVRERHLGNDDRDGWRIVRSMAALREKLLAAHLKLCDRRLELMKAALLRAHPVLLRTPRLRLHLIAEAGSAYRFDASFEHSPRKYQLEIPLADATKFMNPAQSGADLKTFDQDIAPAADLRVDIGGLSSTPPALEELARIAEQTSNGEAQAILRLLPSLPSGAHLPASAKTDMRKLMERYAAAESTQDVTKVRDALIEHYYGKKFDDDWSRDEAFYAPLFRVLNDLEDSLVERNSYLTEFDSDTSIDAGGLYEGKTGRVILKPKGSVEDFEFTLLHEVGHAVAASCGEENVYAMLTAEYGWQHYSASGDGVERWIAAMGGWGTVSEEAKSAIKRYLIDSLGGGDVMEPPTTAAEIDAEFSDELDGLAGGNAVKAIRASGREWWRHPTYWPAHENKRFALNYYYRVFMVVGQAAIDLAKQHKVLYALMSRDEFFAELFAVATLAKTERGQAPTDLAPAETSADPLQKLNIWIEEYNKGA